MTAAGGPPAAAARPPSDGPPDARAAIWALAGELERRHHITRMYGRACPSAGVLSVCLGVTVWCTGGRWLRWRVLGETVSWPATRRAPRQAGTAGAVAPAGPGAGADLTAHGQAATGRRATRPARDQRAAAVRDRGGIRLVLAIRRGSPPGRGGQRTRQRRRARDDSRPGRHRLGERPPQRQAADAGRDTGRGWFRGRIWRCRRAPRTGRMRGEQPPAVPAWAAGFQLPAPRGLSQRRRLSDHEKGTDVDRFQRHRAPTRTGERP